MTRSELLAEVALHADVSKQEAARVISAFITVTHDAVMAGERVLLPGFGTFVPRDIQARQVFGKMSDQRRKIGFRQSRRSR